MNEKECFKCQQSLPLTEFYKHKQMADGHLNKCKACTQKDVRENRESKIEYYRAYDRDRGNRQTKEYRDAWAARYPGKRKAITMVNNAIRDGRLFKEACSVCGTNTRIHAHHDDYSKPLNVRWLCAAHHRQWHRDNGEGKNP